MRTLQAAIGSVPCAQASSNRALPSAQASLRGEKKRHSGAERLRMLPDVQAQERDALHVSNALHSTLHGQIPAIQSCLKPDQECNAGAES